MHILHITRGIQKMPSEQDGAIESVILNLSKNMIMLGHAVTIIDRKYSKQDSSVEQLNGIKICRLNAPQLQKKLIFNYLPFIGNELNHFIYILYISRYLRSNNHGIDVVHIHSDLMGFMLIYLNRNMRKKMYYTTHSNIFSRYKSDSTILTKFNLQLNFILMARIKKSISLSEQIKTNCIQKGKINSNKIVVIPNGVNLNVFRPDINVDCIIQKYNLDNKVTILFVGRIHKIKGIEYLIKAANLLINQYHYNHLQFLLVGPIENSGIDKLVYEDTIHLIKSFNLEKNCRLTGSIPLDELQKLYVACDIFVLPSLSESFGLVITEAMASGKPVVATKTDGALQQVKDNWNGLLVELANELDLAEKIKFLVDNPESRYQYGLNGRQLAEKEFDWKAIAEKHLDTYGSV